MISPMSRVFLSSTWRELHSHRGKVTEALDRLRHAGFDVEWFGMEGFAASLQDDPVTVALRVLDSCDIYVGVLGPRYGSIPEGYSQSYVAIEYERACATKPDRALFLMDPLSKEWSLIGEEPNLDRRSKLMTLRARFEQDRLLNFFDSPGDLAMKVVIALLPALGTQWNREFAQLYELLQPQRPRSLAASIALTASPALVSADGLSSSTITSKITDAQGNNVADGELVAFLTSGFGTVNPVNTSTFGGSASTAFTPFSSNSSGRAYITCVAVNASLSTIIAVDYVGVGS